MECLSYCLADKLDIIEIEKRIKASMAAKCNRYDRVLEVLLPAVGASIYFFSNGTLVSWGLKRYQLKPLFSTVYACTQSKISVPIFEGFTCLYGAKTAIYPHEFFNVEQIVLESDERELKLSLSYGISLSVKLKMYENELEFLIEKYSPLLLLSQGGQLDLSQKKVRQIIGDILLFKSRLNLNNPFLYRPKFFWQHPSLESYFSLTSRYLDIDKRAEAMSQQLNTLNEIFGMCNSYIENKHSHRIELIIVVLIFLEIIFSVLNLHINWS